MIIGLHGEDYNNNVVAEQVAIPFILQTDFSLLPRETFEKYQGELFVIYHVKYPRAIKTTKITLVVFDSNWEIAPCAFRKILGCWW